MQASPNRRFSIHSGHLLYVLTLAASAVSLFEWWGLGVAGLVVLVWWQVLAGAARELDSTAKPTATTPTATTSVGQCSDAVDWLGPGAGGRSVKRAGVSRVELVVVLLLIGLLVGLMIPSRPDADPMRQAAASLRLVAQALKDYRDDCGAYPPCGQSGDSGPVEHRAVEHSWRALLLPYLGERPLADAYRLNEPWDGPHNRRLAKHLPWSYRDFSDLPSSATAVSSPCTTVQIVEIEGRPVLVEHEAWRSHWLEPNKSLDGDSLAAFAAIPTCEQGFWRKGFFASTFRGRLVATDDCEIVVHPSGAGQLEETLKQQCRADRQPSRSLVLGEATTVIHYQRAVQFVVFVGIVLFPLMILDRLRGNGGS